MSFEKPEFQESPQENPVEQEEVNQENFEEAESIFGKSLRCFRRWGRLGFTVGAVLVLGEVMRERWKDDKEYEAYASSSFSPEELKNKELLEAKIRGMFGEKAVTDIYSGDQIAFFERKERERKEPEVIGFAERGWTNESNYAFSEKYLSHPKGWVNGEVVRVEFINSLNKRSGGNFLAGELEKTPFSRPVMYLYRHWEKNGQEEKYSPIKQETIEHELGHANDWQTDMDLNIIDRQELLIKIHERLISPDSWHLDNGAHYHENFNDGTKEGLYKSAKEYWADICAKYFSNPESFLKDHPKDFAIVDTYVKKNDPSFDIFNKDRGTFDTKTGKLKEVWKGK